MSLPSKVPITAIIKGNPGDPSTANQPHLDLESNIDIIRNNIDGIAGDFVVSKVTTPAMNVSVSGGLIRNDVGAFTVIADKATVAVITAPSVNPRIDRVVITSDGVTASIVTGSEAASPVAPAIGNDKIVLAQILTYVGMSTIINADITNETANPRLSFSKNGGIITGNVGLGDDPTIFATDNIGENMAGGGSDLASDSTILHIKSSGTTKSYLVIEGRMSFFDMIDSGGGSDSKWFRIENTTNITSFKTLNDDGTIKAIVIGIDMLTAYVGFGLVIPQNRNHLYEGTSGAVATQYTNLTTGLSAADGFKVGITAAEEAELWNYETTGFRIGTANALSLFIDTGGNLVTGALTSTSSNLQLHDTGTTAVSLQLTHAGTGSASTDGGFIQVNNTGELFITNKETGGDIILQTLNTTRWNIDSGGGLYAQGVMGSSTGVGTINAEGFYVDGTLLDSTKRVYSGSFTSASVDAGAALASTTTHSAGSDDIAVFMMVEGNGTADVIHEWKITLRTTNGRTRSDHGAESDGNFGLESVYPAVPSTGDFAWRIINNGTAQTFDITWLVIVL